MEIELPLEMHHALCVQLHPGAPPTARYRVHLSSPDPTLRLTPPRSRR